MSYLDELFQTWQGFFKQWKSRIIAKWADFKARYPRWALAAKAGAGLGLLGFATLLSIVFMVYMEWLGPLPTYGELKDIRNNTASEVFSEDKVLLGKYYKENRVNASISEISPHIVEALVATEDSRFFRHSGIDLRAWVRVLVRTVLLFDESGGGGSTLSQQLAKNLFPRREYRMLGTVVNKVREMFVARRLERTYTKEELLNLYLNTVPFSENTFGVKVAAQRFFATTPQKIKIEQAATLIGTLKGNTYYSPVRHPERCLQRRNTVLNQMAKYGYLEQAVCDSLKTLPLGLKYFKEGADQGLATYFREHLRLELEQILKDYKKPDGTPYNLYTDGLKIYTTIQSRMQEHAETAMRDHMTRLQAEFLKSWGKKGPWNDPKLLQRAMKQSDRYKALKAEGASDKQIEKIFNTPTKMNVFDWQDKDELREITPMDSIKLHLALLRAGFLAMEPQTGLIRAWVGGIDFEFFKYDHTKSRRQVGSTFKPIVYASALMNGMLPCEYTENMLTMYEEYDNWEPQNSDENYGGAYSMEGALANSVNTVAVEVLMRAGINNVRMLAQDMGISSDIPRVPSIALGTTEASLREMLTVYATLANNGRRPLIHYLDRIETSDGKVLEKFGRPNPNAFRQVVPAEYAGMVTRMLQTAVDEGTGSRLRSEFGLTGEIAGKTGTTQDNTDGWFIGYTPRLVAGAWVGAELPQVRFRYTSQGQGARSALPIWGRFMRKVVNDGNLQKWRGGAFTPLPDTIAAMMDCPLYLDEMPVDGYMVRDSATLGILLEEMMEGEAPGMKIRSRRADETEEEYQAYLQKQLEKQRRREERQETRKDHWSETLFGKKKEDQ